MPVRRGCAGTCCGDRLAAELLVVAERRQAKEAGSAACGGGAGKLQRKAWDAFDETVGQASGGTAELEKLEILEELEKLEKLQELRELE